MQEKHIFFSLILTKAEICSLKWKDIDFEEKTMCVNTTVQRIPIDGKDTRTRLLEGEPKSMFSKREIPLSDDLARLLHNYHTDSGEYVINQNRPMEPRTYQKKFQKYLQFAGIKKTNFHTLRHTFATNCINGGVDIKSLSEILSIKQGFRTFCLCFLMKAYSYMDKFNQVSVEVFRWSGK